MARGRGRSAWAIAALVALGGCAGTMDAATPEAAVASLASALERRDVEAPIA